MAKKGGVQQLQAELHSDEDLERFLERPGLLVLDVYSEWCGPCLGMVGSLRKIKLEIGGDNLQLAICKADTISYLKRFQRKSEPTWLFVTNGRAVNIMFGTNVPKLTKMITSELQLLGSKQPRPTYSITELQPEEVARRKKKEDAVAEAARREHAEKEKKRTDYLTYVTDTIMENLPDIGVTVFGPQVNRDMYKKLLEPAEKMRIQCKDRRVIPMSRADFEVVHYVCSNPLSEEVLEQLEQKELMCCFWKMPEDNRRPVHEVLNAYALELTKQRVEPPDEFNEEERIIPPIIEPMDIVVEVELQEGEEWFEEPEEPPPEEKKRRTKSQASLGTDPGATTEGGENEEGEGEEGEGDVGEMPEMDLDMGLDLGLDGDEEGEKAEPEEVVEEAPKPRTRKKKIRIPPIWVAEKARAQAALIYVFFRSQTNPFLPPDPVPEPPHVIMAFDVYKKRDLINMAERHKDDVPLYGFFTSDDADEARYIASTAQNYAQREQSATDKLIFKVNKQTSQTMLSLATYGPSYVSPNTEIGHEEALKFFPPDRYRTDENIHEEHAEHEKGSKKKKKKKHAEEISSDELTAEEGHTSAHPAEAAPQGAEAAPAVKPKQRRHRTPKVQHKPKARRAQQRQRRTHQHQQNQKHQRKPKHQPNQKHQPQQKRRSRKHQLHK